MPLCCCFGRAKKQKEEEQQPPEEEEAPPDYTPWWVKEEQQKANEEEEEEEEGYQSAGEIEAAEKRKSMMHSSASDLQPKPQPPKEAPPLTETFAEGMLRMEAELGDCSAFDEAQWEAVLARFPLPEEDIPAPGAGMRSLEAGEKRATLDRALVLCIRARHVLAQLVLDHSNAPRNQMLTEEACEMLRSAVDVQSATVPSEEFMRSGISCMGTDEEVSDSVLLETLLRSTIWFQLVLQFQPKNHAALEHWVQRVKDLRAEFPYVDLTPLHTPPSGYCLLHCAVMQNNPAIVLESLSHGCAVNTRTEDSGETALHLVATASESDVELVKELLRAGAHMDAQESQGKTPLFLACENENTDLVQLLLDSNASPDVSAYGKSCMDIAKEKGNESVVRMITRSSQKEEVVDKEEVKERKRAAAVKKKRERAETFQKHNPMEKMHESEGEESPGGGDDDSEADYDESGDEESGSGWSDIGESSKAEEASALAAADAEASEKTEKSKDEELEVVRQRKEQSDAQRDQESVAQPSAQATQSDVDYKSTDLYKEFEKFKQQLASP